MKRLFGAFLLIWACLEVFGQAKLSPNTKIYLSALSNRVEAMSAVPGMDKAEEYISAYIHITTDFNSSALEAIGVQVNQRVADILTVRIPTDKIQELAGIEGISYIQVAVPVRPMMDKVRPAIGVDKVQEGEGLSFPFYGEGVVVGVIDSGFDYTHPDFYDWNRENLRIKRVWEQSYTEGTPPEGFSYGGELKTQEEILNASGDVTTNSHGTHVAGIAAGADKQDNDFYGVAGEADIVLVSMGTKTENNVNLSDAIAYIYKYAESVGKPCVINMSLGTQAGPHDGTSTFDVIADALQGEGRLLVGSVGNFGGGKFHVRRTFTSPEDEPLKTFVDFKSLSARNVGGDIEIWGESGMDFSVEIFTYNLTSDKKVDSKTVVSSPANEDTGEYSLNRALGKIVVSSEVSPLNQKPHVILSSQLTGFSAGHVWGLQVIPHSKGVIHIWADDVFVELTSNNKAGWADGDNVSSLAEIGGTGKNIISVGAFVTRNSYQREGEEKTYTLKETVDDIASFSSLGPTADGRIKPEITAPGCYVVSAVSSKDATLGSLDLARTGIWNDINYYYAYMQGTSMAAPVVAGVVATWLQANPTLTPDAVRAILKKTSTQDANTGVLPAEGNSTWGYGKINAYNGLKESLLMASSIQEKTETLPVAVLTKQNVREYSLLFPAGASRISYTVYSACGQVMQIRQFPFVNIAEEILIDLSAYSCGVYLILVETAKGNMFYKVVLE